MTDAGIRPDGLEDSMARHVAEVARRVEQAEGRRSGRGRLRAAGNKLDAFIRRVRALRTRRGLTGRERAAMIALAREIKEDIRTLRQSR